MIAALPLDSPIAGHAHRRLFLVADDLTGALDAAAQFATLDRPIRVRWTPPASTPGDSIACDTGTRECSPEAARATVSRWLTDLPPHEGTLFFAKLDSLLRGHAAIELLAWLDALRPTRCIIAPAFPFQNRVTVGSRQYIRTGAELRPVASDLAADLERLGVAVSRCRPGDLVPVGVSFWDSADDVDLATIIASVDPTEGTVLWCGSSGLAGALARTSSAPAEIAPLPKPVLGLFGSNHSVTLEQIALCGNAAVTIAAGDAEAAERINAKITAERAALVQVKLPAGTSRDAAAIEIQHVYGELVTRLTPPAALVVAGGETLRAICSSLGSKELLVDGQIIPGIPTSRMRGGHFDGTRIISKSGAFGAPDLLRQLTAPVAVFQP